MIAELTVEAMRVPDKQIDDSVFLDPDQKSPRAQDFEERLSARIVGQERAVHRMSGLYQIFLAGMNLLPAYPLDGGRIVRSMFARTMTFVTATRRQNFLTPPRRHRSFPLVEFT